MREGAKEGGKRERAGRQGEDRKEETKSHSDFQEQIPLRIDTLEMMSSPRPQKVFSVNNTEAGREQLKTKSSWRRAAPLNYMNWQIGSFSPSPVGENKHRGMTWCHWNNVQDKEFFVPKCAVA